MEPGWKTGIVAGSLIILVLLLRVFEILIWQFQQDNQVSVEQESIWENTFCFSDQGTDLAPIGYCK